MNSGIQDMCQHGGKWRAKMGVFILITGEEIIALRFSNDRDKK